MEAAAFGVYSSCGEMSGSHDGFLSSIGAEFSLNCCSDELDHRIIESCGLRYAEAGVDLRVSYIAPTTIKSEE